MCIRDRATADQTATNRFGDNYGWVFDEAGTLTLGSLSSACLLYTFDAADERSSVDLGGRRIL